MGPGVLSTNILPRWGIPENVPAKKYSPNKFGGYNYCNAINCFNAPIARPLSSDSFACAIHAANAVSGALYDRPTYSAAYMARAYRLYRPGHLRRAVAMALKAAGLPANGRLNDWLTRWGYRFLRNRLAKLERVAAAA